MLVACIFSSSLARSVSVIPHTGGGWHPSSTAAADKIQPPAAAGSLLPCGSVAFFPGRGRQPSSPAVAGSILLWLCRLDQI
jgi:hypothetical protein